MQNIVEFLILFNLCMFFTVFSFVLDRLEFRMIFRFLCMITWFILAIFYNLTLPLVPAVGYLFYILGLTFMLVLFHDSWMMWQVYQKKKRGDVDF